MTNYTVKSGSAPAPAGFALQIRQNLAPVGFPKANPVQPYFLFKKCRYMIDCTVCTYKFKAFTENKQTTAI